MLSLCAELGADDGLAPHALRRLDRQRPVSAAARRLCGRVSRLLFEILCCAADPLLQELEVESVIPAPSAARLQVTVSYVPRPPEMLSPDAVRQRLQAARGWLRGELAARLDRRRVPELHFVVVPYTEL